MVVMYFFFVFKQKTAYEMRISDWSSEVCSSDLVDDVACKGREPAGEQIGRSVVVAERVHIDAAPRGRALQDRGIREFIFENTRRAMGARFTKIGRASCRERVCQYV